MKKQGFTLIELMVVIVIMGILAAVAVPKLFGMIAKSKASEVGPAAGTYVKLQTAYYSESNAIGGWVLIGYKGPGDGNASKNNGSSSHTTNFSYAGASSLDGNSNSVITTSANLTNWTATSNIALNDCKANSTWTITDNATSSEINFTAAVNGGAECVALTPSFDKIGK